MTCSQCTNSESGKSFSRIPSLDVEEEIKAYKCNTCGNLIIKNWDYYLEGEEEIMNVNSKDMVVANADQ